MKPRFEISDTPLAGLRVIRRRPLGDERGFLERLYCIDETATLAPGKSILQINRTLTVNRGTLRGMHFQHPPHAETKFVTCLRGRVFDVAVDLRRGSPTFLHWHAEVLDADAHNSLVIPEGFAHGFQTMTGHCEMLYLHTAAYQANAEGGLDALDPVLAIPWPEPVTNRSARDAAHPPLTPNFTGISL